MGETTLVTGATGFLGGALVGVSAGAAAIGVLAGAAVGSAADPPQAATTSARTTMLTIAGSDARRRRAVGNKCFNGLLMNSSLGR